jgi:flavin reductase (DIM6/NTAB) family NADH-FMN oxidoreductase RutF
MVGIDRAADPLRLRRVFGAFPTGVTAVGALIDGRPVGIAASSFASVSLDPPLVSVAVAHRSRTWPILRSASYHGISVLSARQERGCRTLGAGGPARFADLDWRTTESGALLIEDASAWLECSIEHEFTAGDHDVVVFRVRDLDADADRLPLVFHGSRYRRLHD